VQGTRDHVAGDDRNPPGQSLSSVSAAVISFASDDTTRSPIIAPLVTPGQAPPPVRDLGSAWPDANVHKNRITPEEAQTISAILGKRAELFAWVELAAENEALRSQLAGVAGAQRPRLPIQYSRIDDVVRNRG
jgi:hypothetical protein